MNEPTFKEKFQYWFDNQMSKGSMSLIKLLTFCTLLIILLISVVYMVLCGAENGFLSIVWDSLATVINAYMPMLDDVSGDTGYLIFLSVAALCGLLLTSVLIGIISTGIEEKLTLLKQGNSRVLEKNHTVIVGFTSGEFTLIRQLILANPTEKKCLVVACEQEREEVEQAIRDNVKIPDNIRIIVRSIDIFDSVSLEKCSLSTAENIIISPTDDKKTAKILLAISLIINETTNDKVHVGAIIQKEEYKFPDSVARKHNVTTLQTSDVIAKIIAHSCTMPGLSSTFIEMFNFEGSEMYTVDVPEAKGLTFFEISEIMDEAVPMGIYRDGKVILNPELAEIIRDDDKMIIFAPEQNQYKIQTKRKHKRVPEKYIHDIKSDEVGQVAVLGYNDTFATVLEELPENVTNVLVESKRKFHENIKSIDTMRYDMEIDIFHRDINKGNALLEIAKTSSHIVLLSDPELSEDDADLKTIFRIMALRDLREKHNLVFNITAQMHRENNRTLIKGDDNIDFVVASNLSSLFLAQLAESPELSQAFSEILSNEGNELFLKSVSRFNCAGKHSIRNLRRIALANRYILLGYMKKETFISVFNSPIDEIISLSRDDKLIVLGQD